jgi:hypothetical protein
MRRERPAPRTGAATQRELWAGAADELARAAGPSCPVQPERDVRVKRAQRGQIATPRRWRASHRLGSHGLSTHSPTTILRFITVSA